MNKISTISDRGQQKFISAQQTVLIIKVLRLCPCDNEVGCKYCNGLGEYFDDPVLIKGAIVNGINRSEKETRFPKLDYSEYDLIVHPQFEIAKGDRIIPFNVNIYETFEEIIDTEGRLSFHPARARTVKISFAAEGQLLIYKYGTDFTIAKGTKNLLNSKTITWLSPQLVNRQKFVARYQRVPEYVVGEIPEAKMAEGKKILQTFRLKKLLAPSETDEMEKSGFKAAKTITSSEMIHE